MSKLGLRLKKGNFLPLAAIILVAAGLLLRWYWITHEMVPFNSDEAVIGLMARHILAGERPIFFYGQAYMGSLDAYFSAFIFSLIGSTSIALRITQSVLWMFLLVSVYFLGRIIFQSTRAGWWAVLLMAVPPVNFVLYTTVTLGGYTEALIIGCWSYILAFQIVYVSKNDPPQMRNLVLWLMLGFFTGFGLWVFGFSMVFTIPAMLIAIGNATGMRKHYRYLASGMSLLILGILVGSLPWWLYALQNGFSKLILELVGSAVNVEGGIWLTRVGFHLVNFVLLGLPAAIGLRPPWSVQWILLALIPFVLLIWSWILLRWWRMANSTPVIKLIFLPIVVLFFMFLVSSFGVDPSGRYFVPVTLVLILIAAGVIADFEKVNWRLAAAIATVLIVFHFGGAIQAVNSSKDGLTTQFAPNTEIDHGGLSAVQQFLLSEGIHYGYTTYWVAYPLNFLSNEELVFIPRLPYHTDFRYTARDDRYPPYTEQVLSAEEAVYITYDFPDLDQKIQKGFASQGVTWTIKSIGKYNIYYQMDKNILPVSIGLGGEFTKK